MSDSAQPLIACHECDALYVRRPLNPGVRANCVRCGAELYRHIANSLDKSLAYYASAFAFLIIANSYPFLSMQSAGLSSVNRIYSGSLALYRFGMWELGMTVFLTSNLFPALCMGGMLYLLSSVKMNRRPPHLGLIFRSVRRMERWSLLSVFMLGTLIAIVKLQSLAPVSAGPGLYAFALLLLMYTLARVSFDPEVLWQRSPVKQLRSNELCPGTPVINCHYCSLVRPVSDRPTRCARCGAPLRYRTTESVQRTWALLFAAAMMLVPANLLPVMTVTKLGKGSPDTIYSGIVKLIAADMWGLAMIVLFASLVVPTLKLVSLAFLLRSVQSRSAWRPQDRTMLYRVTEWIGAWSMVDVFLVGVLSGLVSLGVLATVEPGIGATFFAAAVILTMLAALSFDPRLIWDSINPADGISQNAERSPA